jgi:hypothetical protein
VESEPKKQKNHCWELQLLYIWVQITSGSLKKYRWHPDEVQNPFSGQNEVHLCLEV